ncbi:MAG: peptidyl-prolyl cis-trans isomerase, partial [Parvularculaceae bacterium]|nr:peptidyl-prolyl cis-trans isomerase [Parvularculaceae bacterium]
LGPKERRRLIDDYVREEALYREAKALGLDANDYVIRQRLVESAAFLSDASETAAPATDAEIEAYFKAHRADYRVEPSVTFAHVFFEGPQADAKAASIAAELNARNAPFEDAPRYGDRFPFHTNYVERTYDYVASQFGEATTRRLFDPKTPLNRWVGALRSEYGAHAVYVSGRTEGRDPELSEIKDRVAEDANRDKRERARLAAIDDLVRDYAVKIAPDATAPPPEVPQPPGAQAGSGGQNQ